MRERGGRHILDDSSKRMGKRDISLTHNLKLAWTIIGIAVIIIGIGFILHSMASAIWALVLAGLIVFVLRRPMAYLGKKRIPRLLSAALLVVGLLAVIVIIIISFIPLLSEQLTALISSLPGYLADAQEWWESFFANNPDIASSALVQEWVGNIWSSISNFFTSLQGSIVNNLFSTTVSIGTVVIVIITAFIIAYWLLVDYDRLTHEIHSFTGGTSGWYVILVGTICSRVLAGFLKGTLITALCVAVVGSIVFAIIGLPSPIAIGLLLGLCSIVPYLGPAFAAIAIGILALISGTVATCILAVIFSVVIPWVLHTVVQPRIMESTANLHPGITMLAIIIGAALGGVPGTIIAIPVSGVLKYFIIYFYESVAGRQIVTEDGALFAGIPSDPVDPVADATEGYLTYASLKARVASIEGDIKKIDADRSGMSISERLGNPMSMRPEKLAAAAAVHPEDELLLAVEHAEDKVDLSDVL